MSGTLYFDDMKEKSEYENGREEKNQYVHIERKNEKKKRRRRRRKCNVEHYAIVVLEGN